ncbi:MAG: ABC transporter permease subunit [Planctomycetota bacterium]|jgi:ABC-type transport system involved in multi-copper enzyme maturation permease subunit
MIPAPATKSATRSVPDWVRSVKRLRFGLPVLMKDLTELAARRRTYIIRSVYASLLFMAFALFFMAEVSQRGLEYRLMGAGRDMLEFLTIIQLVGVYLFLPAMVAPAVAGEKERGTLGLLFTTDLGPWEILIQKYLGRLAPMFMLLLLSLPLMAVAYTYGGFSSRRVLLAAYVIFTTCMQIAAWALMWSAFCRNTSEATGATYSGAIVIFIAACLFAAMLNEALGYRYEQVALLPVASLAPPMLLESWGPRWGVRMLMAVLPWVWTAVFLLLARRFLVTRAFKKKSRSVLRLLRDLVRFLVLRARPAKARRARGATRSRGDLPANRPVVWRELSRSALRTPGGFLMTWFLLVVPLVVAAALLDGLIGAPYAGPGVAITAWILWIMVALIVAGRSVSAFGAERANQTLELLVTTPLTGREIVAGKAAAIRRRGLLALLLLGVLFVVGACLAPTSGRYGPDLGFLGYLFVAFMSVPIYLGMAGWLSGWIGLRMRRQSHATAIAFGAVFGICVGPFLLGLAISAFTGIDIDDGPHWLFALSPAMIIGLTEVGKFEDVFDDVFDTHAAVPILLNWIVCIGIAATFRALCLANADRYLGRPVSSGDPE